MNNVWMKRAIELAKIAESFDEVPVGAVLVRNNEIVAEGYNARESSCRTLGHAELIALDAHNAKASSWRLPENTELYVTVEPCLMCTGALLQARLSAVYFGCLDTKNAGLSRVRSLIEQGVFDHRFVQVESGILEMECRALLSNYFSRKRT